MTEMEIEVDGVSQSVGAIGGLFTPQNLQYCGYANTLMKEAEEFIFGKLQMSLGILFCMHDLVPFYMRRNWSLVTKPVTLQQKDGVNTWGAAVMILNSKGTEESNCSIHVPNQKFK